MIALILDNLLPLLTSLVGLLGIGYGTYKSKQAEYADAKAAQANQARAIEAKGREIAEASRDLVINHAKKEREDLNKAIENAKVNRDTFFNAE